MANDVSGLGFPFRIDPATGGVAWSSGAEKIRQNVRVILNTRIGERPMLRDFGSRVSALVQDPNDDALVMLAQTHIQQALAQWEPRLVVTSTSIARSEGELSVRLTYALSNEPVAGELFVPLR